MWNLRGVAKVACMLRTLGEHDGAFDILAEEAGSF